MKRSIMILFFSFIIISVMIGCGDGGGGGDTTPLEPKLSSIETKIFEKSCAFPGCHGDIDTKRGLNLKFGKSRENLVDVDSDEKPGVGRVVPGDPDNSYLILKLEGNSNIDGERMPLNGSALTNEEIAVIREWITNGALDN
ncbi:MAG: hypothetical protein ACE5EA_09960 [Nitrospirota bacterium]